MREAAIIGVDLANNVFQLYNAASDGSGVFRKKPSRPQFAQFMSEWPPCLVVMEARASAHHQAREMSHHGHKVRPIAPHCVKPFLKRQKNDAEAALRPTMRIVEPRSSDQQARAVAFRTRAILFAARC